MMLLLQKVSGKFELKMFIMGDVLMESIKRGLVNFGKGFGIWIILLLFNTRSGESDVNGIKIILDVILAVILVGNYRKGKYMAMLVAILTTVITLLPLQAGWEILLLLGITALGWILLKVSLEDVHENQMIGQEYYESEAVDNNQLVTSWKSRNWLNPFESYAYSPDAGVSVCKGIIRRTYSTIPTMTTRAKIHQSIWQRLFGFCDVSFQNNYTGQQFGEEILMNIRFKSAIKLMQILP